jgi:hypothetical protein
MLLRSSESAIDAFETTNQRCLYSSSTHCEAPASLRYGFIGNRGSTALRNIWEAPTFNRYVKIRTLNSKLTDPNYIEPGQRIGLPAPLPIPVTDNTTSSTNARTLHEP